MMNGPDGGFSDSAAFLSALEMKPLPIPKCYDFAIISIYILMYSLFLDHLLTPTQIIDLYMIDGWITIYSNILPTIQPFCFFLWMISRFYVEYM